VKCRNRQATRGWRAILTVGLVRSFSSSSPRSTVFVLSWLWRDDNQSAGSPGLLQFQWRLPFWFSWSLALRSAVSLMLYLQQCVECSQILSRAGGERKGIPNELMLRDLAPSRRPQSPAFHTMMR